MQQVEDMQKLRNDEWKTLSTTEGLSEEKTIARSYRIREARTGQAREAKLYVDIHKLFSVLNPLFMFFQIFICRFLGRNSVSQSNRHTVFLPRESSSM